ncbi:MAG: hypothetical protein MRY83_19305 [Flavobacteriales bacterium]|nr:hypothetical protein [Flavobacteriales bacterium]
MAQDLFKQIGLSFKDWNMTCEYDELRSRKEVVNAWKASGYLLEKELPFLLKWNKEMTFSDCNGIWKVYLDKGKVSYINATAFKFDSSTVRQISIKGHFPFYESLSYLEQTYGLNYLKRKESSGYWEVIYPNDGLLFLFHKGLVMNVHLFLPIEKKNLRWVEDQFHY